MTTTQPGAQSETILYQNLSTVTERLIIDKIKANNSFNNKVNVIKDIRNCYESETSNRCPFQSPLAS